MTLLATSENTVNGVIADILDGMKRSWTVRADPTGEIRRAYDGGARAGGGGAGLVTQVVIKVQV